MGRPISVVVGGTSYDRKAADRAASVLRGQRLPVEVVDIEVILCPGAIRKQGWVIQVPIVDARLAERYLKEASSSS